VPEVTFEAFLRSQGIAALAEVRTVDLRAFLAQEATHRPAPSSQGRTVAALRCFFSFCVESDYTERDPAHVLRTPKKREALPDVLDRSELSRLLGRAWPVGRLGARARRQARARPAAARPVRPRRAAPLGAAGFRLRQRVVPIHPGSGEASRRCSSRGRRAGQRALNRRCSSACTAVA
jgi:integrase